MNFKKGITTIIVTLMIVAILGALGLIVDKGRIYYYKWKLTNATQAAVMGGLQDLPDIEKAYSSAYNSLNGNNFDNSLPDRNIDIIINGNDITATGTQEIPMTIAQLLGYPTWTVSTEVTARLGAIAVEQKVAPIGVEITKNTIELYKRFRLENDVHYSPGTSEINYKYYPLNYSGGLINNIKFGYSGDMKINHTPRFLDPLNNSTFNQLKTAFESIDNTPNNLGVYTQANSLDIDNTPRLIRVAIIETPPSTVPQYTQKKIIKGFALFYIEQVHVHTDGGKKTVSLVGFFLKEVTEGPIINSPVNYGIVGTEFIEIK